MCPQVGGKVAPSPGGIGSAAGQISGAIRCGVEVPHHVPHEEVVPLFSRLGHPFKAKDVVAFPTIGKGGHVMMARRENWRDEEIYGRRNKTFSLCAEHWHDRMRD